MIFASPADYDRLELEDRLEICGLRDQMLSRMVEVQSLTGNFTFQVRLELSDSELEVLLAGGRLRYLKERLAREEQRR